MNQTDIRILFIGSRGRQIVIKIGRLNGAGGDFDLAAELLIELID
jgi:hypothetical protein